MTATKLKTLSFFEIKNKKLVIDFWEAVEVVKAENDLAVAQERRHGTTSWMSPLFVSLRNLMEKSEEKMNHFFPEL